MFQTMTCLYCGGDVDEETPTHQAPLNILNKFNTQLSIIFELVDKVENIRLADFILRPEPVDIKLERMRSSRMNENWNADDKSLIQGKSAKMDKWSGDKTRHVNLLGQTRISINFDWQNAKADDKYKIKDLPAILLFNRTHHEEERNKQDPFLFSLKMAGDEENSK